MSELLFKQQILYCYPHVLTKSIHKMVGCQNSYVYEVLRGVDLKPVAKTTTVSKTFRRGDKWNF